VVNGRLFLALAEMELAGAQDDIATLHTAESLAANALAAARQLSCVLGMLSSLEVKVLCPT
jgi:hypothetical protein